jgi:hypothetical protein
VTAGPPFVQNVPRSPMQQQCGHTG